MMMSASERAQVNRVLMQNGFGTLNDPGLIAQLGFVMSHAFKGHDEFRTLINKCEPSERRTMYETMRPYLRFEAKPLDVYIAELAQIAEMKQMPAVAEDGSLVPFKVQEISSGGGDSLEEIAQAAIRAEAATRHLELTCKRCTLIEVFHGWNKQTTVDRARQAGWRYDAATESEICPKCAGD